MLLARDVAKHPLTPRKPFPCPRTKNYPAQDVSRWRNLGARQLGGVPSLSLKFMDEKTAGSLAPRGTVSCSGAKTGARVPGSSQLRTQGKCEGKKKAGLAGRVGPAQPWGRRPESKNGDWS